MAFCAPRQLTDLLPAVVPTLVAAFDDPHPRVQAAGRAALADVGRAIRSPELAAVAPALLAAVADPANATAPALAALARTDFVHALDAPACVGRGRGRGGERRARGRARASTGANPQGLLPPLSLNRNTPIGAMVRARASPGEF
jgi:hypothetical protein